jgi:multidrug efflux pump subunit AcrA (membrane-fusion protein)
MNRSTRGLAALMLLVLVGCARAEVTAAIPTLVLDSASSGTSARTGIVRASGILVPVRKVELSFPFTGIAKNTPVRAGDTIRAGDVLVELDTAILEARVAQAAADVAAGQAQLNYLIRQGQDEVHLQSARADIDRAQASLDAAGANLTLATMRAPFDGTAASVEIAAGETVVPGQIVILLAELTRFQVESTDLSELDVSAVSAGQSASILVEALSLEITGRVTAVALVSESLGGDVVYRVSLELDEQPAGLRWGMSTEIAIQTEG